MSVQGFGCMAFKICNGASMEHPSSVNMSISLDVLVQTICEIETCVQSIHGHFMRTQYTFGFLLHTKCITSTHPLNLRAHTCAKNNTETHPPTPPPPTHTQKKKKIRKHTLHAEPDPSFLVTNFIHTYIYIFRHMAFYFKKHT